MQVSVEVLDGLQRKITIKVPNEGIEQEIEKRLKNLAPRAKIAGFRAGKVPVSIVRERFGSSVRNEVITEILQSTYHEAIRQEKLAPAGLPTMEFINNTVGQPLEYEAKIEIYPPINMQSFDKVKIDTYDVGITAADIEDMLQRLRKQHVDWIEVDRAAQTGDQVLIDFDGHINGKSFEGGSGKQAAMELGVGGAIPGFEEGLVGTKAGQTVTLNLQFPHDYAHQALASQRVELVVKIHKVSAAKLPELNEEFASKFGVTDGGIPALKEQVRENMQRDAQRAIKEQVRAQVLEKLVALNPLELPRVLVDTQAERIRQQVTQQLEQSGYKSGQAAPASKEQFIELAKQQVTLGLLFGEFVKLHQLKVDQTRLQEVLTQMAAAYKDPENIIAWYRNNKAQMASLENTVLEEQVIEELTKQAHMVSKPINYFDLIKQQK